jgi:hypothetical protein
MPRSGSSAKRTQCLTNSNTSRRLCTRNVRHGVAYLRTMSTGSSCEANAAPSRRRSLGNSELPVEHLQTPSHSTMFTRVPPSVPKRFFFLEPETFSLCNVSTPVVCCSICEHARNVSALTREPTLLNLPSESPPSHAQRAGGA